MEVIFEACHYLGSSDKNRRPMAKMSDFLFDHFTQMQVRNFVVHIGLAEALCFTFPIITSKSEWLVEGGSRHTSQFWNDP